ncbi:MAG: NfeD family protein [Dehalococcoidales bacterium]|nr:NfeD family protein [Dehalococcoidales bacterium]
MKLRLIWAIVSIILEEMLIVLIALFVLPGWNINIPVLLIIAIMIAWLAMSVFLYVAGFRALDRKLIDGPEAILGKKGKVIKELDPRGLVKINGELWSAESKDGNLDVGEEVIVTSHEGIKLVVKRLNTYISVDSGRS